MSSEPVLPRAPLWLSYLSLQLQSMAWAHHAARASQGRHPVTTITGKTSPQEGKSLSPSSSRTRFQLEQGAWGSGEAGNREPP